MKQCPCDHVQPRVIVFSKRIFMAACLVLPLVFTARAAALEDELPVPDVLIYHDGDRVQGRLIAREGDILVFRSVRFGELRVPESEVQILTAGEAPKEIVTKVATVPVPPAVGSSPDELTRYFKDFFGPWHGRFAISSEIISDTTTRSDLMVEARLNRTWPKDEVSMLGRFDYSKTDDVVTTDVIKGNGLWRHTLPRRLFTVYRPSYEWNRAFKEDNINKDYVLLQQEVGLGVTAVDKADWKVRVGVAENFFDSWDTENGGHGSAHVESLFAEADLKLPWRIVFTERAVFYYAIATGNTGWENQFEVTKKLTDTLSLGLRHEVRYNDPDVRSQDYSLLRFLLGFDF